MTIHRIAIPVLDQEIVPRFDLATEVLVIVAPDPSATQDKKTIILPRSSADELCHILLSENINILICGAIEDEYYQFLQWKEVEIYDNVIGTWPKAVESWQQNTLFPGKILLQRQIEGRPVHLQA